MLQRHRIYRRHTVDRNDHIHSAERSAACRIKRTAPFDAVPTVMTVGYAVVFEDLLEIRLTETCPVPREHDALACRRRHILDHIGRRVLLR